MFLSGASKNIPPRASNSRCTSENSLEKKLRNHRSSIHIHKSQVKSSVKWLELGNWKPGNCRSSVHSFTKIKSESLRNRKPWNCRSSEPCPHSTATGHSPQLHEFTRIKSENLLDKKPGNCRSSVQFCSQLHENLRDKKPCDLWLCDCELWPCYCRSSVHWFTVKPLQWWWKCSSPWCLKLVLMNTDKMRIRAYSWVKMWIRTYSYSWMQIRIQSLIRIRCIYIRICEFLEIPKFVFVFANANTPNSGPFHPRRVRV